MCGEKTTGVDLGGEGRGGEVRVTSVQTYE